MKKVLRFNQGPYAGRDVEVDEDEAVIQNYLDTGYCSEAEVKAPEPAPKRAEREVAAEVAPQPEAEVKEEPKKKAPKKKAPRKKRIRRKRETPEG